jgi:YHS domain-containing protein
MRKELIAVLLAALTVSVFATDPSPTASASAAASDAAVNTICPVSGDRIVGFVGKPLYAQYEGKNIAVCCNECLTKFQQNPEKYGPLALKNDSGNEPMKR